MNIFMKKIAQKMTLGKVITLIKNIFGDYVVSQIGNDFKLKSNALITVSDEFINKGIVVIYDPHRVANFDFGIRDLDIDNITEDNFIRWLNVIKEEYKKEFKVPVVTYKEYHKGGMYYFTFFVGSELVEELSFDKIEYTQNRKEVFETVEKKKKELEMRGV